MLRHMMKAKIHRAIVSDMNLEYEGSITIDLDLLTAAGIKENEMVMIVNLNNGERFHTYAIEGEPGSGVVALNGGAARKGTVGDLIIIITSAYFSEAELEGFEPLVIKVDENNKQVS